MKNTEFNNANITGLDSFFDSEILLALYQKELSNEINDNLKNSGFSKIDLIYECVDFKQALLNKKYDLIILSVCIQEQADYNCVEFIRKNDADVAIITISDDCNDQRKNLEYNIRNHFIRPFDTENIVRAAKKAIGDKKSYEIGMQFFDALFGMQMCTHRDLHQRTFDHVIRTTKIYGKFLLYLTNRGIINLTSWSLKNCLMASLVHDIGKLLIMHGVLYKDGKLTSYEYQQIKRHPWNSITALLGGQDIEFFAKENSPVETVSGYNEKNLSAQVQKWIFKIFEDDFSAYSDVEKYFTELSKKPFIHSLNKDLLYIVFRHHDGIHESYHKDEELDQFAKIMGRPIEKEMNRDLVLDIVTNCLTICDMYDALLDVKRDYRKFAYTPMFALFLLYSDMKKGKFFPDLMEYFTDFVINEILSDKEKDFNVFKSSKNAYKAIENVYALFKITPDQESDFNEFLIENVVRFDEYSIDLDEEDLIKLNDDWVAFFTEKRNQMISEFYNQLNHEGLITKRIEDFTLDEIKVFDMLYKFYFSYSSSMKRKRLIDYLKDTVINPVLDNDVKKNICDALLNSEIKTRKQFERSLVDHYSRRSIFEVFSVYDEEILINELNEYLRKQGY